MEPTIEKIPEHLIYEWVDGQPVYYKGYQQVLNGQKQSEDIMGSSYLQSLVISRLVQMLFAHMDIDSYELLFNEVGIQLGKGKERSLDIAVFPKERLKGSAREKYLTVAPELVIEVDIKAEGDGAYMYQKTDELLKFGVDKIIWVLTKTNKVMVAERGKESWQTYGWDKEIPLLEGISVKLTDMTA